MQADVGDYGNLLYVHPIIHTGSQSAKIPHMQGIVLDAGDKHADATAAAAEITAHQRVTLALATPGALVTFGSHTHGEITRMVRWVAKSKIGTSAGKA